MISIRLPRPSVSVRNDTLPMEGRRCASETTVSATDTASTVTWLSRTTGTGFSAAQVRPRQLGGGHAREEVGLMHHEAVVNPSQAREGPGRALEDRDEGVGQRRVGPQFEQPGQQDVALLPANELLVGFTGVSPGQQ